MHYNNLNHKLDNLQKNQHGKNKAQHNSKGQHFYPRTVKLTKIKFTKEEMALLNHGLQHSIEKPLKTCWTNLKIETEQAIKLLDTKMQNPFRILATKKLKQIFTSNSHYNATQKWQAYIIKNLNHKLVMENAIIVKTDKCKTTVITWADHLIPGLIFLWVNKETYQLVGLVSFKIVSLCLYALIPALLPLTKAPLVVTFCNSP